jgi:hypothetical protein
MLGAGPDREHSFPPYPGHQNRPVGDQSTTTSHALPWCLSVVESQATIWNESEFPAYRIAKVSFFPSVLQEKKSQISRSFLSSRIDGFEAPCHVSFRELPDTSCRSEGVGTPNPVGRLYMECLIGATMGGEGFGPPTFWFYMAKAFFDGLLRATITNEESDGALLPSSTV